jgi:hypothetical protein
LNLDKSYFAGKETIGVAEISMALAAKFEQNKYNMND